MHTRSLYDFDETNLIESVDTDTSLDGLRKETSIRFRESECRQLFWNIVCEWKSKYEIKSGVFRIKSTKVYLHTIGQHVVKKAINYSRDSIMIARAKSLREREETEIQTCRKISDVGWEWVPVTHWLKGRWQIVDRYGGKKVKVFSKRGYQLSVCVPLCLRVCLPMCMYVVMVVMGDRGAIGKLGSIWKVWLGELVGKSHPYVGILICFVRVIRSVLLVCPFEIYSLMTMKWSLWRFLPS